MQLVYTFYNIRTTWEFSTKLKCSVENIYFLERKKAQKKILNKPKKKCFNLLI